MLVFSKLTPFNYAARCCCLLQGGDCAWCHQASGKRVSLGATHLLNLTEIERLALRKLAHSKLQAMDLGCTVSVPKGMSTMGEFLCAKEARRRMPHV